jgi:hypothetical protein
MQGKLTARLLILKLRKSKTVTVRKQDQDCD